MLDSLDDVMPSVPPELTSAATSDDSFSLKHSSVSTPTSVLTKEQLHVVAPSKSTSILLYLDGIMPSVLPGSTSATTSEVACYLKRSVLLTSASLLVTVPLTTSVPPN